MSFDHDRIRKLMTYRYDPGTASPRPKRHHIHQFRDKEFTDGHLAELFHENTKFTEDSHVLDIWSVSLFVVDETMQLIQGDRRNDYPGYERIDLPAPERELGIDLGASLSRRRSQRVYDGAPISLQELSTLLGTGLGISGTLHSDATQNPVRAYPSGGGLYPVEIYVAVINGDSELDEGLYYYVAEEHALRILDEDVTDVIDDAFIPPEQMDPKESAICLLFTGAFWRTYTKYGPRGYRFVLQESGHIGQNVQLVADALGYGSVPIAAVQERQIEEMLGINGVDEALIYSMFVGSPQQTPNAQPSQKQPDAQLAGGDDHE